MLRDRSTKCFERFDHELSIVGSWPNHNIEIARGSGYSVQRQSMGADDHELSPGFDQGPQHVEKVVVEAGSYTHCRERTTRPGMRLRE